ncbi:MAG: long-chain fatty acid--CoA ligase [Nevskia sp.]|nr:long-chain fatty acid--CoA ligase [Nevskia sp.]
MGVDKPALPSPVEMLLQQAKQRPDQPYLHQPFKGEWRAYTWAEVADQSRRMASALLALGLPQGSRILLTGMNTAHWFMADFACGLAGLVGVGLYPKQSEDAVRFIAGHSEAKAVFIGPMPDAAGVIGALPQDIIKIALPYPGVAQCELRWDELIAQHAPLAQPVARDPNGLWSLIYTSGTTGNPKGVIITQTNLTFTIAGMLQLMPARAGGERFLSYLPLAHAFERGAVEVASLYLGAQVYFLEELDKLPDTIKFVRPTRFFGVPLVWTRIQAGILKQLPSQKLDRLLKNPLIGWYVKRKIRNGLGLDQAWLRISGAAPMPMPVLNWFHKIGLDIYQGYGMTENSIYVSVNMPHANRLGSVGKPYEDSLIRIAPDGEIQNKHAGITPGYYKDAVKTQELFSEDGWLRTGDVGRLDADGYLYITGRVKEIFKTLKGKYVTPAPIEGSFASNRDVDQVCLVGSGLNQPVMVVSLTTDAEKKSREEIGKELLTTMETINAGIEAHEAIAKIIISKQAWSIDNNMMTPTMKVRRNEIEKHFHDLIEKAEGDRKQKLIWES